jgi:hypothetical protein
MRSACVVLLGVVLAGCACGPGLINTGPLELTVAPDRVEFPPTFVGQTRSATLELTQRRGPKTSFAPAVDAPFSLAPRAFTLVAGQAQALEVQFSPTSPGTFTARLTLETREVEVHGEGLAVPACVAPRACVASSFDVESATCREETQADGTTCETRCVTGGCEGGACVGALKGCDDQDACTIDACSEADGCSHAPRECPELTTLCRVPRCDSASGCVSDDAPDGTLCGPDDCRSTLVDICLAGSCVSRPRPTTGRCANRWVPISLPGRAAHAMAYDAARKRVILFGGGTASVARNDTWEWDGQQWTLRTPATSPPARWQHAMAYDSVRKRIVLFGGRDERSALLGDTWEWDGVTWVERTPTNAPPPRAHHELAYDASRQRTVLFGGQFSSALANDTWEWNGSNWVRQTTATSPSLRYLHAMAYDAVRRRVIVYGGYGRPSGGGASGALGDTWEWNGTAWTELAPSTTPGVRTSHSLEWDPARQRLVLFSGIGAQNAVQRDTWEWDGTTWSRTATTGPAERGEHAVAFDAARGRLVLFGGFENDGFYGEGRADTWEWDGTRWTERPRAVKPPPRYGPSLAYDPVRQRIVLWGGLADTGLPSSDVWEWDGATWRETLAPPGPQARWYQATTWDGSRQRLVSFGGVPDTSGAMRFDDTWDWNGFDWQQRTSLVKPLARYRAILAYDSARQELVLTGGFADSGWLSDTWVWGASGWIERTPAGAAPNLNQSTGAFDDARQRLVVFGGESLAETWSWDGASWQPLQPMTSPPGRVAHAMAYDPVRQRVMLFGGVVAPKPADDTWEWDGTNWLQRMPVTSPPPTHGHAMAYDAARQRMVLVERSDTWLFLP